MTGLYALPSLNGEALDVGKAAARKAEQGAKDGFFLATEHGTADFYAARREGGVLEFSLSQNAVEKLAAKGAKFGKIPVGARTPAAAVEGAEFVIPPDAFDTFNELRKSGEIVVRPAQ
jgi:hypothetical protein